MASPPRSKRDDCNGLGVQLPLPPLLVGQPWPKQLRWKRSDLRNRVYGLDSRPYRHLGEFRYWSAIRLEPGGGVTARGSIPQLSAMPS